MSNTTQRSYSYGTSTSNRTFQDSAVVFAAREMENRFTELPTMKFLELLPDHPGMPKVDSAPFKDVAEIKSEKKMYDPFASTSSFMSFIVG